MYAVERKGKIKLHHEINKEKLQSHRSQLYNTLSQIPKTYSCGAKCDLKHRSSCK